MEENIRELDALISMLDDPDMLLYQRVKDKIFAFGTSAIVSLEYAMVQATNPELQMRIEGIIHEIQLDELFIDLRNWYHFEYRDLLKGFILVSKYYYPDLDVEWIEQKIQKIRQDIWLEINDQLTALEKVGVVNHIIYGVHRFGGNTANLNAPQNMFINTLLETRKGNALSLGMLYIIVTQGLGVPVRGVNLPEHFVLMGTDSVKNRREEKEALFYINPLKKGSVFTRREIGQFLKTLGVPSQKVYYQACSNRTIVRRLLGELQRIYQKMGYPVKEQELKKLEQALD